MDRHIVACGGGGWSGEPGGGPLEDYILGLAPTDTPSVCLLATASGDSDWVITRFHEFFGRVPCRATPRSNPGLRYTTPSRNPLGISDLE